MKKTLTKSAALLLVFAMLLSVFAVFAGSTQAKQLTFWDKVQDFVNPKVQDDVNPLFPSEPSKEEIAKAADAWGQYEAAIAGLVAITNDYNGAAVEVRYLDGVLGINAVLRAARIDLALIVRKYADETEYVFYGVSEDKETVTETPVLNFDAYGQGLFDNKVAGYSAQLQKLVDFRNNRLNLVVDVEVSQANLEASIKAVKDGVDAIIAIPKSVVKPVNAVYGDVKAILGHVADIIDGEIDVDELPSLVWHSYKVATGVNGGVANVKAAVEAAKAAVVGFPTTVGSVFENAAAFGQDLAELFNYVLIQLPTALQAA